MWDTFPTLRTVPVFLVEEGWLTMILLSVTEMKQQRDVLLFVTFLPQHSEENTVRETLQLCCFFKAAEKEKLKFLQIFGVWSDSKSF